MDFRAGTIKKTIISTFLCLCTCGAIAQTRAVDSLVFKGDSLRMAYDFEQSISVYNKVLSMLNDSTAVVDDSLLVQDINDRLLLSENGRNMAEYAYSPKVVARHCFSLDEFFLYYPLKDSSWRSTPCQLDTVSGPYAKAVYAPDNAETIYFSAPDNTGIRNIYATSLSDTVWSAPALINEELTSASDEIYPMLSADGKTLYFASKGLFGVGGYDLYVSSWDEETGDWSEPANMGFPYSSPANDFLLVGTEDGKYMIFASDRDCAADSVNVYVLEQESIPVRSAITDPLSLQALSRLEPIKGIDGVKDKSEVRSEIPENVDMRRYMDKMSEVRSLRDSIYAHEQTVAKLRDDYSLSGDSVEKSSLAEKILSAEIQLPALQERLGKSMKQLQDIEMDFLFSGVVIDPDNLLKEAEREVIGEETGYVFSKMVMGTSLKLNIEVPEPEFDYSFKVLEEAQVLRDTIIRKGIVYQIQIMSADRPVAVKRLKGLSPVFEMVSSGGRYNYRVGLFHQYKDVLPHLNTVRRLGFSSAYIVAMIDGVEKKVAVVRNREAELKAAKPIHYKVIINGELDTDALAGVRQQVGSLDMAKADSTLIVGPFESKEAADALMEFIEVMGYGQATLEQLNNE